jgi:hypothetical protein
MSPVVATALVIGVLVLGTYLLQGAILLLQVAIWAAVLAAKVAFYVVGTVVWCVWWLFDRDAATKSWREAEARERALRPAGWR